MSDKYAEYEAACEQIREQNAELLQNFEAWLGRQNVSASTIRRHISNADLYINHYLLYEDSVEAARGISSIGMFMGYWYIRKVSSSETGLRNQAASLKKFYQFMFEQGLVLESSVISMNQNIASEMPRWLGTIRRYYDEEIEDPDEIWG